MPLLEKKCMGGVSGRSNFASFTACILILFSVSNHADHPPTVLSQLCLHLCLVLSIYSGCYLLLGCTGSDLESSRHSICLLLITTFIPYDSASF